MSKLFFAICIALPIAARADTDPCESSVDLAAHSKCMSELTADYTCSVVEDKDGSRSGTCESISRFANDMSFAHPEPSSEFCYSMFTRSGKQVDSGCGQVAPLVKTEPGGSVVYRVKEAKDK